MTNAESWLRANRPAQVALLQALVRTRSVHPPGDLGDAAEATARLLEGVGFTVERHPVPRDRLRGLETRSITNLIVRECFGADGPTIALNANGDTVPAGHGWRWDPFGGDIADGWLHGRGAMFGKSDISVYAFALAALKAGARPSRGCVELHITWDGEAAEGTGVAWMLEQDLTRPTHAVAAGLPYIVATSFGGCIQIAIDIHGRSAHAALPGIGIDALEAAYHLLGDLYAERAACQQRLSEVRGMGAPQLSVSRIEGGGNRNVLPERVRLVVDRRLVPEEDLEQVERGLIGLIGTSLGRLHGIEHDLRVHLRAAAVQETPASAEFGERFAEHATRVLGQPVMRYGLPFFSDARHYAQRGIPTIRYGAGPRTVDEGRAHRADERVPLAELHAATLVTVRALEGMLG